MSITSNTTDLINFAVCLLRVINKTMIAMPRLQYILKELNIQAIPEEYQLDTDKPTQIKNRRLLLANFAEELAKKKVQGMGLFI